MWVWREYALHQKHDCNARHHSPVNNAHNTLVQRCHLFCAEIFQQLEACLDLLWWNGAIACLRLRQRDFWLLEVFLKFEGRLGSLCFGHCCSDGLVLVPTNGRSNYSRYLPEFQSPESRGLRAAALQSIKAAHKK